MLGGCFDLLHAGHLNLFERAAGLGDTLIVALNSDSSARRLKGAGRPLLTERQRVAAIERYAPWVHHCVIFEESDPRSLIVTLKPKFFVKGIEYKGKQLFEEEAVASIDCEIRFLKSDFDIHVSQLFRGGP